MAVGPFDSSVGFIIQARMASSRLPGKVLMAMPFGSEETILSQICNSLMPLGAKLIVATSKNPENDAIEAYCTKKAIVCFRGDEEDVLSRFCEIQANNGFEHIFRFTADNPLVDKDKLKAFFNQYLDRKLDYAYSEGMPLGMNFEVFRGDILNALPFADLTQEEKEHVTLYIRNSDEFNIGILNISNHINYRMTVDTPIDYAQLSLVFQVKEVRGLEGVRLIDWINKSADWILNLNEHVLQNNSYSNPSEEINAVVRFLKPKGYSTSVEKLLE